MSQQHQSVIFTYYPHLIPGLCGALECPRPCTRVCHCEAGLRLTRRLLAWQAMRRFDTKANRQQVQVCDRVTKAGLCPKLCLKVGGCFLPQRYDHTSELKRKANRPQLVLYALARREIEANIEKYAPPQDLPKFSEQLKWERDLYSRNAPPIPFHKRHCFELGVDHGS